MLKKTTLIICLAITALSTFSACNSESISDIKNSTDQYSINENIVDNEVNEEEFEKQYEETMDLLLLLNVSSNLVGTIHSIIWDNVGSEKVAEYINYVREYYDSDMKNLIFTVAFGDYSTEADEYARSYVKALATIEIVTAELDEKISELNKTFGNDFNIDDLKDYYIESITYAEYASNIDGSYITYNQTLNDYKTSVEKFKKRAEIAY